MVGRRQFARLAVTRPAVLLIAIWSLASLAVAQPPFGGGFSGGGPPGGGPPGGWRGPDPDEIIQRLDDNKNGQVDVDEMGGRSRFFLDMLARDNGLDLSKPIPNGKLKDMLKARFGGGQSNGGSSGNSGNRSSSPAVATPGVPGFGTTLTAAKVPGFGLDAVVDSWDALKAKYGDRVVGEVQDAMRRYDKNNDGILDAEELKNGQWRSDPREYDKNRDGKLSRGEMAERYKARYGGGPPGNSSGGSSSGGGTPYGGSSYGGYGSYGGYRGGYGYGGSSSSTSSGSASSPQTSSTSNSPSNSTGGSSRPAMSTSAVSSSGQSSSGSSSSSPSSSGGVDERVARYAEGMLKQYDKNGNGVLDRDEWTSIKGEPQKADRDNNGLITKDELAAHLSGYGKKGGSSGSSSSGSSGSGSSTSGGYSSSRSYGGSSSTAPGGSSGSTRPYGNSGGSSTGGPRKTVRFLSPVERLPKGLPDWFTRNDADGDGQIAMAEFSSSWNDAKAAEFAGWDRNGDGIITPKEALAPRP